MLIFKLKEVQARYNVANKDLAAFLGVGKTLVSEYRSGAKKPKLDRLDKIMDAIAQLGDREKLRLYPLSLSDLLEWREDLNEKPVTNQKESISF